MAGPLQRKAFWGMIWSAAGNFSLQLIQFVVGVQLACILTLDDYGLVGMLVTSAELLPPTFASISSFSY